MATEAPPARILVVEDDAVVALNEIDMLERNGYRVDSVRSGEAAVRQATDPDIDLVLMDIRLGDGIGGDEAARRIIEGRDVPIVFVTQFTDAEVVRSVHDIPRYGYVVKSCGEFVFLDAVSHALERSASWKRAQEYQFLFERLPDTVAYLDANLKPIRFMGGAGPLASYDEEAVGQMEPFSIVHPEDVEELRRKITETVARGLPYLNASYRVRIKDGSYAWIESASRHLYRPDGSLEGVLVLYRDISVRKRVEEDAARLLRTNELLLHEVHHRVKNDMAIIRSMLSMQAMRHENREMVAALEEAMSRISVMEKIYESLYLRENVGELSLRRFLGGLLDSIAEVSQIGTPIDLRREIADVVIPSSRAFAVGIIVNELVTNAYKYAFVSIPRGRIDIVAQMIGTDRLEISVSDNGTGMKVTSLDPAMGFGLQMVNALARQHGGTMAIHAPRTGSKITVEIAVS